jgi:diguanylate cyclase (GGDEF)-like protein
MNESKISLKPDRAHEPILILGDTAGVLFDGDALDLVRFEVHADAKDSAGVIRRRRFLSIYIVLHALPCPLNDVLRIIRDHSEAKIFLLAHLSEEPIARRYLRPCTNGRNQMGVDGYLVYPTRSINLLEQTRKRLGCTVSAPIANPVEVALERRVKQLEKRVTEDDLTGLKNRHYIWEFARQVLAHAKREGGRVTLLVYDIDDFKHYNDVYGHTAGDSILIEAAILMSRCCRAHDVVGRVGGDEFAVVFWDDPMKHLGETPVERRLTSVAHPKEPIFIAQRFRKALEETELCLLGPYGKGLLTISGGLASYPSDGETMGQLFDKADTALLEAKRCGKNRIYLVGTPQNDIDSYES